MPTPRRRAPGAAGAVVGLVLAAIVAAPWVGHGHVLLLDWVSGPHTGGVGPILGVEGNSLGGAPFLLLLALVRGALGSSVASWLPLVGWMPLAGWGVGTLVGRGGWPASASAAALACCNPFTLDRITVGQVAYLWGYALLPVAALTLAAAPRRPLVWAARAGLVGAALTATSPHLFAYWLVLVAASVAVLPMAARRAGAALLAIGGALCASCYLLAVRQPAFTVGAADLGAYRTRVEPPGLVVTILSLHGFWRQSSVNSSRSAAAWVLAGLLAACMVLGAVAVRRRREVVAVGLAGLIGAVLAAGDQGPFGGLYRLAFQHIGPVRILREPQKASALLAIALSVLFGFGVARLVGLLSGRRLRTFGAIILAVVPLASAPVLPVFGTKVAAVRPSAAWRQADRLVGPGPTAVLALPWHQYMSYPSTGSPVANLAPSRFRAPVASGDNVELPGLASTSSRRRSAYLEERFREGPTLTDFGAQIEPAGLGWVLLVKTVDWTDYQWLDGQRDLVRVLDTPELSLYRSTAPSALSAATAVRRPLAGWLVRSSAQGLVPLPEIAEARWHARRSQVGVTAAGAPSVLADEATVRSRNVEEAVGGLALSGGAAVILGLVALGRQSPRRIRRRARGRPPQPAEAADPFAPGGGGPYT